MIIHMSLISKSGDCLADCMECDYDIDYDCDVCPHCGLESPVSYKWFNIIYKERIENLKVNSDLEKLAELYFDNFRPRAGQISGEASPSYLFDSRAAEQVREMAAQAHEADGSQSPLIIAVLRDPAERALSSCVSRVFVIFDAR